MFFKKRKNPRYAIPVSINVRMNGKMLKGASCSNISLGGMCVVFEDPVDIGNTGKVWIKYLSGKKEFTFEGDFRKIWAKKVFDDKNIWRVGVIFTELIPEQRDNLYKIVKNGSNI